MPGNDDIKGEIELRLRVVNLQAELNRSKKAPNKEEIKNNLHNAEVQLKQAVKDAKTQMDALKKELKKAPYTGNAASLPEEILEAYSAKNKQIETLQRKLNALEGKVERPTPVVSGYQQAARPQEPRSAPPQRGGAPVSQGRRDLSDSGDPADYMKDFSIYKDKGDKKRRP